ncbi:hypothetical protein DXD57_21825 [Bacteroides intestinalis]|nr:hypothetical protein DXD57_21825 [Bacteroides intestinalis]
MAWGCANGKTPEKQMSDYAFREKKSERLSFCLYAKHSRMVTNSPRNKNFRWLGAGNRFCKRKNSRKANVGLRFSGEKIRASVVLSY